MHNHKATGLQVVSPTPSSHRHSTLVEQPSLTRTFCDVPLGQASLARQQGTLVRDSPTVSPKPTIRAGHPMARNEHCDPIACTGPRHGTCTPWHPHIARHGRIGSPLPRRDLPKACPNPFLKPRAAGFKGHPHRTERVFHRRDHVIKPTPKPAPILIGRHVRIPSACMSAVTQDHIAHPRPSRGHPQGPQGAVPQRPTVLSTGWHQRTMGKRFCVNVLIKHGQAPFAVPLRLLRPLSSP